MDFIINRGTTIEAGGTNPVKNAAAMLRRDISKVFNGEVIERNEIVYEYDGSMEDEDFVVISGKELIVKAGSDLGFVYGLIYISSEFLGVKPFWFWMDTMPEKTACKAVPYGEYRGRKPVVKYRGWFVNDEVLIMKWNIGGDSYEPWRMVFEALLRCGGNTVIPGTDKNSRKYRQIASDMGLWITHHHAEPLGAEMFIREYPDLNPSYDEHKDLFIKLWEDAVKEQCGSRVIWSLGFRGQGDYPFWNDDKTGRYSTEEARGKLISDLIELQRSIVKKYVDDPVFCTNLYGEITELYDGGYVTLSDDIIKVSADNGYGKMVARRQDNHSTRTSSMPKSRIDHGGIYYHVSFYDLQAANHITMLQNSVDFVNRELTEVLEKNMSDMWIINCSNVRPHVYFLDAVRRKWYGEDLSDESMSTAFSEDYFGSDEGAAKCLRDYHNAMASYGAEEDEHTGEQFYNENVRYMVNRYIRDRNKPSDRLVWLTDEKTLAAQAEKFSAVCRSSFDRLKEYYNECLAVSEKMNGDMKKLFDATVLLHAKIHRFCSEGMILFTDGLIAACADSWYNAFMTLGKSADAFDTARQALDDAEYGVWKGFYFNECFADIKYTVYMVRKLMGVIREFGDNERHDYWYREAVYAPEDRKVMTLLVNDNHMTDDEIYRAFLKNEKNDCIAGC